MINECKYSCRHIIEGRIKTAKIFENNFQEKKTSCRKINLYVYVMDSKNPNNVNNYEKFSLVSLTIWCNYTYKVVWVFSSKMQWIALYNNPKKTRYVIIRQTILKKNQSHVSEVWTYKNLDFKSFLLLYTYRLTYKINEHLYCRAVSEYINYCSNESVSWLCNICCFFDRDPRWDGTGKHNSIYIQHNNIMSFLTRVHVRDKAAVEFKEF